MHVAAVGDIQPPSSSSNSSGYRGLAAGDHILGLGDYQYQGGSLSDYNSLLSTTPQSSWYPRCTSFRPHA